VTTSAKIIADSVNATGDRLTTMEVTFHRFVLAEFNTHRVFSRNSASSRAIPVTKQMERVTDDLAYPVAWPAEQRGMQGGDALPEEIEGLARDLWQEASWNAIHHAGKLVSCGLHKSVSLH